MSKRLVVDLGFKPWPHQRNAHDNGKRFSVLVWHRRAGKTVYSCHKLVEDAVTFKGKTGRFGYICPFRKQAKDNAWKYITDFARQFPGTKVNESELYVEFRNGARITLYGADNPDSIRGMYFDGVVLDEAKDMKPMVWGEVVRPMLMDREGWVLFIGSAKGINLFSERYYAAVKDDEWFADLQRWNETGVISEKEIAKARKEMTETEWASEMECDFAAAVENALIPLQMVLDAQEKVYGQAEYIYAPRILGVDVARYGGDRSCIFPRQGLVAMKPRIIKSLDTMEVSSLVAQAITKWKPHAVFIDEGGVGAGVVDRLLQLHHDVIGVNFAARPDAPEFMNKRVEMWWSLHEWLKDGGSLPGTPELVNDLTTPLYTFANAQDKRQLESKDAMKKRGMPSPDVADALALTFAYPVSKPEVEELYRGHLEDTLDRPIPLKPRDGDYNPFERGA